MRTFLPDQLGGLTSMNLHDLITLIILFIGTSRTNEIQYIKYTSEYILKLQIYKHIPIDVLGCMSLKSTEDNPYNLGTTLSHGSPTINSP